MFNLRVEFDHIFVYMKVVRDCGTIEVLVERGKDTAERCSCFKVVRNEGKRGSEQKLIQQLVREFMETWLEGFVREVEVGVGEKRGGCLGDHGHNFPFVRGREVTLPLFQELERRPKDGSSAVQLQQPSERNTQIKELKCSLGRNHGPSQMN